MPHDALVAEVVVGLRGAGINFSPRSAIASVAA
jgi:hypothetical protein